MKIAVSSSGQTPDSQVDPRFGRSAGFIIYDTESNKYEYKDNSANINAMQGAGIQGAKNMSDYGVSVLITGHCGPKAFSALKAAGIKIYSGAAGTVAESIEKFNAGALNEADSSDVEGHWM